MSDKEDHNETEFFDNLRRPKKNNNALNENVSEAELLAENEIDNAIDTSKVTTRKNPNLRINPINQLENEKLDQIASSSKISPDDNNLSTDFTLKVQTETLHGNISIKSESESIKISDPTLNIQQLFKKFPKESTKKKTLSRQNQNFIENNLDWEVEPRMALEMRDIIKLIPEYNGEEKSLDTFIRKINKLWEFLQNMEENDRVQFLLVLQLKLVKKAADAVQDNNFDDWDSVRQNLIEYITPHRNTEKSELKLCAIKQKVNEELEVYAKRVEEALETLNRSFAQDDLNDVIKKENDRKARKAFENGLIDPLLRNKAIAKSSSSLKEPIDYIIEQELRHSEIRPRSNLICSYCKNPGHAIANCRKRNQNNPNSNNGQNRDYNKDVTCYKCGKKNHYANECKSSSSNFDGQNKNQNRNNNFSKNNNNSQNRRENFRVNKSAQPNNTRFRGNNQIHRSKDIDNFQKNINNESIVLIEDLHPKN